MNDLFSAIDRMTWYWFALAFVVWTFVPALTLCAIVSWFRRRELTRILRVETRLGALALERERETSR